MRVLLLAVPAAVLVFSILVLALSGIRLHRSRAELVAAAEELLGETP